MTTTWQILDTKRQLTDGLVIKIICACTVQLGNCIDRKIEEVTLEGDSSSPDFQPFQSLTPNTLIEWAKTTLGTQQVAAIEKQVQDSVTALKAAKDAETVVSGLPWLN